MILVSVYNYKHNGLLYNTLHGKYYILMYYIHKKILNVSFSRSWSHLILFDKQYYLCYGYVINSNNCYFNMIMQWQ